MLQRERDRYHRPYRRGTASTQRGGKPSSRTGRLRARPACGQGMRCSSGSGGERAVRPLFSGVLEEEDVEGFRAAQPAEKSSGRKNIAPCKQQPLSAGAHLPHPACVRPQLLPLSQAHHHRRSQGVLQGWRRAELGWAELARMPHATGRGGEATGCSVQCALQLHYTWPLLPSSPVTRFRSKQRRS